MPAPLHPIRKKQAELMDATVADHKNWTYEAVRPLPIPPTWKKGQKVRSDCSLGVKLLNRWSGGPDPMNTNYGPYGNSTTLCAHLPHVPSPSMLEVADVITFGKNGDEHAAVVREAGVDPLLWSDGHQGAPNFYRLSQDRREAQYLKLVLPHWKPTKGDILRAKTGYWSWLQWKLGEGDWRGRGEANPTVRPDVPKWIPVAWRRRRWAFLRKRKNGNPPKGPKT